VAILSQAHEVATAFLGAALIGLRMAAEADVMPYLISRYFGLSSFSEIYGYALPADALAATLGPLLDGLELRSLSLLFDRASGPGGGHAHRRGGISFAATLSRGRGGSDIFGHSAAGCVRTKVGIESRCRRPSAPVRRAAAMPRCQ
jgi:hypothetical protein